MKPKAGSKADGTTIAISLQYRERWNMTYELDCIGVRLILRIFFPAVEGDQDVRIEARTSGDGGVVVDRSGPTRALALTEIAEAWRDAAGAPPLDWQAVTLALKNVRAV